MSKENKRTILHQSIFDTKFEVGINFQDKGLYIEDHYHDYIELVCQLEGESTHYIDNKRVLLKSGHMLIINTTQLHRNIASDYNIINVVIPEDFLDTMLIESSYDQTIIKFKKFLLSHNNIDTYQLNYDSLNILKLLAELYHNANQKVMYQFQLKLYLLQLFISFNSIYINLPVTKDGKLLENDLMNYIGNNLLNASLNEYAEIINYSPSRASQRIMCDYNASFIEILQSVRMKEATKLLLSSTHTIDYIMAEVGYSNKTFFYNIFKQQYGLTPNQYRKKYKKN